MLVCMEYYGQNYSATEFEQNELIRINETHAGMVLLAKHQTIRGKVRAIEMFTVETEKCAYCRDATTQTAATEMKVS